MSKLSSQYNKVRYYPDLLNNMNRKNDQDDDCHSQHQNLHDDNKRTCCQGGGLLEAAEGGKRVEQLGEGLQLAEQEAWLQL